MGKIWRSVVFALTVLVVVAMPLFASSASEIIYPSFMWGETWNAKYLNELKEAFEKDNAGVTVNGINVPISSFWDKQYADVTAGNPPDILTLFDTDIVSYMDAGLLEPLNPYLEKAGFPLDGFVPSARLAVKGGQVLGVPMQVNPRALVYNDAVLKQAKLEVPKTTDEFYRALKALRDPAKQQFGYATFSKPGAANVFYIEISPITIGMGGGFFKAGKPRVTDPEMVGALKFYKRIYDEGLIPRGVDHSTYRQMFIQGKIAMYAAGGFILGGAQETNPETYKNLRTTDLPFYQRRSFTLSSFLSIPKKAPHKELAAKLLMTMLQDKWQGRVVEVIKAYPARKGMVPETFKKDNPWFEAFERAALTSDSYAPQGAEQYGPEIMKIIATNMENMLFKGVEADQMAKELQAELEKFMASKR
jgi:multiple sugar transport system substrate-binding protein